MIFIFIIIEDFICYQKVPMLDECHWWWFGSPENILTWCTHEYLIEAAKKQAFSGRTWKQNCEKVIYGLVSMMQLGCRCTLTYSLNKHFKRVHEEVWCPTCHVRSRYSSKVIVKARSSVSKIYRIYQVNARSSVCKMFQIHQVIYK